MSEKSVYESTLEKNRKTGIPRLLEIAGTKSWYLAVSGVLAFIAAAARITPFITVYLFVRELIMHIGNPEGIDRGYILTLGWYTLAGVGVFGIITYAGSMLSHIAAFNILYEIRLALAAKLARMPMGYFSVRTRGGIKKVLYENVERIELFIAHHTVDLIQAFSLPFITLIFLFIVDWRLALGVMIPIPLALVVQFSMFGPSGKKLYAEWQKKLSAMNGTIVEYVRGMPVVKVFRQTVKAFKRFADDVYAYRDLTLHWVNISLTPFAAFLTLLSSAPLFIIPIVMVLVRNVGPAEFPGFVSTVFLFLYIGMGIAIPLYKLMRMSGVLTQITSGLEEIDDILSSPEIPDSDGNVIPDHHGIEFQNVEFAYGESSVLKNISFRAEPGTVTALVGPSGGGKSTIANLIGRFWDVGSGSIRIGGRDIRDMRVESLNDTVSTVFQDVTLFFDTIEENIRMGNDSADFEDIEAAAKSARIHDFIMSLPMGYKTLIGEGGTYLSGGEQQRISVARAILKDAPVVVLDEATAYADPENESRIQQALSVVLEGKTVIIIAHRLYTITDADQILFINNGTVAESGTHEELTRQKGFYARMWGIHAKARNWNIDQEAVS